MEEIDSAEAVERALDSLLNDRLALLAGAGLSIAPPSCLPAAADLALAAKQKYEAMYGQTRPPLSPEIEVQAQFFFEHAELATVYFRTLIDQNTFAAPPNPGHYAVADLLLVRGLKAVVTTNVDALIETAGVHLFGEIAVGLSGVDVAQLPADVAPLLKIHGCRVRDRDNMV